MQRRRRGIVDFVGNGMNYDEDASSYGRAVSSISYASEILRQLQRDRQATDRSASNPLKRSRRSRSTSPTTMTATATTSTTINRREATDEVVYDDSDRSTSEQGATVAADDDDDDKLSTRRRLERRPFLADVIKLRSNVSMLDHMDRLQFALNWCDLYEKGKWFGVKRFVDCYFSLVFKPYLGPSYKLNIIHVAKMRKVCAVCILSPEERLCTLLVMLNYPLWDRLLQVSASLPTRYFRKSIRQRLIDGEASTGLGGAELDERETSEAYNVSLGALCLIDRLEYAMSADLHNAHLDHVVTLSPFLANSHEARQVFRTDLVFE